MSPFEGFSDNLPELEPRDYLFGLSLDFDPDSQLTAIAGLLRRNRQADAETEKEIKAIEDHARHLKGLRGEWAVDSWVDELHYFTYQSAAHSMSAVGMIAPLTETMFYQCFQGMGSQFFPNTHPVSTHARWNAAAKLWWDCHFVLGGAKRERDVARGIVELADAVGLLRTLPPDIPQTLAALFSYRSSMFHNGFEWPLEERQRFAKRVARENWPLDWFSKAESGHEPWIFYMTDAFIDHCLSTINRSLDAIGVFVREVLVPLRAAAPGDANK
jgi:hypothetical protein